MEFQNLPEECIVNILSFTTPRDVCVMSLLSSTFRSASKSDAIWEKFLPSDCHNLIPTSLCFDSKKDIYIYLSHNTILIDNGQKSFVLEKAYGKKCYMLSARSLFIVYGDNPGHWRWTSLPESRFLEVAELIRIWLFEIRGRIKTCLLSPKTLYEAYLVFKPSVGGAFNFKYQLAEVSIGIVGEGNTQKQNAYLDIPKGWRPHQPISFKYPKERRDGWWEIKLGDFFNEGGEEKEVEMSVHDMSTRLKGGIILEGIEIRPS